MFVLCIVLCTAHVLYSMGRYLYCPYKAGILSVPGSSKDRYLYCSYKAGILYGQLGISTVPTRLAGILSVPGSSMTDEVLSSETKALHW